jgi:LacI family gluconate utilization system Gnt-I transcriptional repressor
LANRSVLLKRLKNKTIPKASKSRARPGEVTFDVVAAQAGVSGATVSRYFNNPEKLSRATAARVREVVNRLAFVPNLLAGGLASNRTQLVAAVIPTIAHSIFSSTIQAICDSLARHGFGVALGLTGVNDEHTDRQLMTIIGHRPNGIILTGTTVNAATRAKLKASGIPTIETWDLPADPIDMVVGFSHAEVGRAVGQYVVKTGRRHVLIISSGGARAQARRASFEKVLKKAHLPEPVVITYPGNTTYGHGREAVAGHLDGGGRPDLVLCSSDWSAHGAMDELRRRGVRVPEGIAVIGFGDIEFAAELDPPLTSVKIDGDVIGQQSATFLMKRARGEPIKNNVVDVGFELIVRGSST